jgi:hypothetical protein
MSIAVNCVVDDTPLPAGCDILAVRVDAELSRPTRCELLLDDAEGRVLGLLGRALQVQVEGDTEALFTGTISAAEIVRDPDGTAGSRLIGHDMLQPLAGRSTVRSFADLDAGALVRAVADGCKVLADTEANAAGPRFDRVVQHRHRDLELLTETLGRAGLYLAADGDALHVVSLDGYGTPLPLHYGTTLHQVTACVAAQPPATGAEALAWQPQQAETLRELAGDPPHTLVLLDEPVRGAGELRAVAGAAVRAAKAGATVLEMVAEGDARLRPGRRVQVGGVADRIDDQYTLTGVTTIVDADGYRAECTTRPPALVAATRSVSFTLGTVTAVDDPDRCGRVRVSLPAYGALDLGWVAVLTPGAGTGRGLVVLPDIGDAVLVALPHDVGGDAVVLG